MTKTQATTILTEKKIDWTAPFIDIIDTLTYAINEARPSLTCDECIERADRMAARWAE
jgi:hypothetical protein